MTVTIVAVLCQTLQGTPLCHEEIVHVGDSTQECILSQAALADWKRHSRYASDDYRISRIKCIPGRYEKRDAL